MKHAFFLYARSYGTNYSSLSGIYLSRSENNYAEDVLIKDSQIESENSTISHIDCSLSENLLIWNRIYDNRGERFFIAPLNKSRCNETESHCFLRKSTLKNETNSFCYDWIHRLIYKWNHKTIQVSHIDSIDNSLKILKSNYSITDLVLNPIDSYIFWSELWEIDRRTSSSRIMRANQDGNGIKILVDENIIYVTNIAIDFGVKLLFFIDKYQEIVIHSIDFYGNNHKINQIFQRRDPFLNFLHSFESVNNKLIVYMSDSREEMAFEKIILIEMNSNETHVIVPTFEDHRSGLGTKYRFGTKIKLIYRSRQTPKLNQCLPTGKMSYKCFDLGLENFVRY
jgi:hypothetical protein